MILYKHNRRRRKQAPLVIKMHDNFAGQGGSRRFTFEDQNNQVYSIQFESEAEVKQFLSLAHIAYHNFTDERMTDD